MVFLPPSTLETSIVSGRDKILSLAPALVALGERSGQPGRMDFLSFFLNSETSQRKTPHLVLIGSGLAPDGAMTTLFGAVLLYEYRAFGRGTGIFATDDTSGRRTVIAPAWMRPRTAVLAGIALMSRHARAVLITCEEEGEGGALKHYLRATPHVSEPWLFTLAEHRLFGPLSLETTLDLTFAKFGKHTRRNMRQYRRKTEATFQCTLLPAAALTLAEYLHFNQQSTHPVSEALASWRYHSVHEIAGCEMIGLQASTGEWLSLIGARRFPGNLEIDWQINRGDLPEYSLSIVMRAFLIEAEIARGTTRIWFEGGSANLMRRSFDLILASDLTMVQDNLAGLILRKAISRLLPKSNHIAQILGNRRVLWRRWLDTSARS